MDFTDALNALFYVGTPLFFISFAAYYCVAKQLIRSGQTGDKLRNHIESIEEGESSAPLEKNVLAAKWLEYGGGYYGGIALLTFIYLEALDLWQFFGIAFEASDWSHLVSLDNWIDLLVRSYQSLITAMVWFTYWGDVLPIKSGWLWLGLSYASYWLGQELATYLASKRH